MVQRRFLSIRTGKALALDSGTIGVCRVSSLPRSLDKQSGWSMAPNRANCLRNQFLAAVHKVEVNNRATLSNAPKVNRSKKRTRLTNLK